MSNQEYIDTFDEVRDGYKKLRGTFLKVTDQHWVTVNRFEAEGVRHDPGTGSRQCVD